MKRFFALSLLLLSISLDAKETWHLELKDGTIFSLIEAPSRDTTGKFFKFKINGYDIEVSAKSVVSLTTSEALLDRFIYEESKGQKISPEETSKAVVRVKSELHRGSGTLIHPDGYILTNNHLVSNNHELVVTLHDGNKHQVEIVAKSSLFDLAILKIKSKKGENITFPYVRFDDERKLDENTKVYTFSTAVKRPWKKVDAILVNRSAFFGSEDGILYQQYRIKMRPDDTGSPLFDEDGSMIGILTQKTKSMRSKEIWFSTPISFVKTVMKNLNAYIHNPSNSPIRYNKIDKK